jgi:hypothetical protein
MNKDTIDLLLNPQENKEWFPETDEDWETRNQLVEFYRQVVTLFVKDYYDGNIEKAQQDLSNCYHQEGDFGGDFNNLFAVFYGRVLMDQGLTHELIWVPLLDTLCVHENLHFENTTEIESIFF